MARNKVYVIIGLVLAMVWNCVPMERSHERGADKTARYQQTKEEKSSLIMKWRIRGLNYSHTSLGLLYHGRPRSFQFSFLIQSSDAVSHTVLFTVLQHQLFLQ